MKKGFMLALVALIVLALAVPIAMALTDVQKTELKSLYEQEHQLRQQIIDKQVEAGLITPEDAANIKERMTKGWEFRQEQMTKGNYLFGPGRGGRGLGFGRRGSGGCGNSPKYQQDTTTAPAQSSSTL